jgi:hypothetical protein
MEFLEMLNCFLAFVKGVHCPVICPVGLKNNEVVWRYFNVPNGIWKYVCNWSKYMEYQKKIAEEFLLFGNMYFQPKWRDIIQSTIEFYTYANNAPSNTIAIVMIQAALEKIAHTVIVVNEQILLEDSYKKLNPETEKVRMLFRLLKISIEFDKRIELLLKKIKMTNKPIDFIQLMFDIRNSTMHPVNKFDGNITILEEHVAIQCRYLLEQVIMKLLRN